MNKLIPHIEYLLQIHDCVVVPGFGALLAHGEEAWYNEEANVWIAPRRIVSFNPDLSRTDGLLAASVARREDISIETASLTVEKAVREMRDKLESERQLSLGAAGTVKVDDEGYLNFVPYESEWLSPAFMWLPYVTMPRRSRNVVIPEVTKIMRRSMAERLRMVARAAACLALVVVLTWIVAKNLSYEPNPQFATIAPVEDLRREAALKAEEPVKVILTEAPDDEVIENVVVAHPKPEPTYFLIVASLASKSEADKFVSQFPDFNLGILEKDGRYRVYAAAGATVAEVAELGHADNLSASFPNSWVCRR